MTTDLEYVDAREVRLVPGATPTEHLAAAVEVANTFSGVVKEQRLFKRIGDRDHPLIEAWQSLGALVGVFATDAGGVHKTPWPDIGPLPDEPPGPGPEPRRKDSDEWREWENCEKAHARWRHHRTLLEVKPMGADFGYTAAFVARKNGQDIGWGEGRVDRFERTWANRENYALASMAQTRAQSRALAAPLKWIVKLAGYEDTTPAEEMDGAAPDPAAAAPPDEKLAARAEELERELALEREHPYGPWASEELQQQAAQAIQRLRADLDGFRFVLLLGQQLGDIPEVAARTLRALGHYAGQAGATGNVRETEPPPENAPPESGDSAYHNAPEGQ